jgi:hypothetical protein
VRRGILLLMTMCFDGTFFYRKHIYVQLPRFALALLLPRVLSLSLSFGRLEGIASFVRACLYL